MVDGVALLGWNWGAVVGCGGQKEREELLCARWLSEQRSDRGMPDRFPPNFRFRRKRGGRRGGGEKEGKGKEGSTVRHTLCIHLLLTTLQELYHLVVPTVIPLVGICIYVGTCRMSRASTDITYC